MTLRSFFVLADILIIISRFESSHIGGDADEEDINYCFEPLKEYFENLPCRDRDVLKEVRGIHPSSQAYFSSRVLVLPYVEVRDAKQEDHDDLADVFNS